MTGRSRAKRLEVKAMREMINLFDPCPFCGGLHFRLTPMKTFHKLQEQNGDACIGIECVDCYANMYEHTHKEKSYYKRVRILARKWNTRKGVER